MTTTGGSEDTRTGQGDKDDSGGPWVGLVVGLLSGAGLAALVCGLVIGRPALWGPGAGVTGMFLLTSTGVFDRRSAKPVVEWCKALAMIESRRATSGEYADVPVAFDLTVAPDDRPAFRARANESINLVDLPDYQVRGIVVVEYRVDKPWEVRLVTAPDPEWAGRRAEAVLDSAPESSRETSPEKTGASCLIGFLGLLAGAAVIIVLFRGDLFKDDDRGTAPASPSSMSSTGATVWESTTVSESTTTADVSTSVLTRGQPRTTADESGRITHRAPRE